MLYVHMMYYLTFFKTCSPPPPAHTFCFSTTISGWSIPYEVRREFTHENSMDNTLTLRNARCAVQLLKAFHIRQMCVINVRCKQVT